MGCWKLDGYDLACKPIVEDIGCNYMCYSTAKEFGDSVTQVYYDLGNQSQVFELNLKLRDVGQGGNSVTQ